MLNVRLAGGHLYGEQLFTWLSLVVSLMASFVLSIFPLDVLDEIWDVNEPVSEGFLTYSFMLRYIPYVSLSCDLIVLIFRRASPRSTTYVILVRYLRHST